MESFGPIIALLIAMPFLAAIGITTLAAFALMSVLGLMTEMSFKRIFFVSFFMGLAAPLLVGGAVFSIVDDARFQRDLRDGFDQFIELPEDAGGTAKLGPLVPRLRELRDDMREGDMSDAEIERRIEGLFEDGGEGGVQIEQGEPSDNAAGDEVTVDIDGVQLSRDGDTVRIQID
ncbi:MAG: hypothetical protein AAF251_00360 [Pseudomonadota bacterium]